MIGIVLCSLTLSSFASSIDSANDQMESLEKNKKKTEAIIAELDKEKGNTVVYIEKLDKELSKLKDKIDKLVIQTSDVNIELKQVKEDLIIAKQTEANQYETMKKRIKYMYENGNNDYIEILLNSESISDLLNRSEYISKISEYDNNMLVRYEETKNLVISKEDELQIKLVQLEALKEEIEYEQSTSLLLMANKKEELESYDETIAESELMIVEYDEEIEKQEAIIEDLLEQAIRAEEARLAKEAQKAEQERIEKQARLDEARKAEEAKKAEEIKKAEEAKRAEEANKTESSTNNDKTNNDNANNDKTNNEQTNQNTDTDNSASNGADTETNNTETPVSKESYKWPVPSSSRITSYFGNRDQPTEGASTYHKGIDIGAPAGTKIIAAASGSVLVSAYSVSAGNYIMLSHGSGIYTVYMHCSKLLVSVGDTVSQGSVIAEVGSTGYSTGSHLHFGISVNGGYVNPLNYVSY